MSWTEVRVTLKPEGREALMNYMHEAGAGGTILENNEDGSDTIIGYFQSGKDTELVKGLEDYLTLLGKRGFALQAQIATSYLQQTDWAEEWKKHYQPLTIGDVYISPSWIEGSLPAGKTLVRMDPGMAFGTGLHPTTQMCILQLTNRSPGKIVLDLGTGSGILAIVAAKSEATRVAAFDNDQTVLLIAAENAANNNCRVDFSLGDAIEGLINTDCHLAVANIGYSCCDQLAKTFVEQQKPCTLVLSGFLEERLPEFLASYGPYVVETHCQGGWVCLVLEQNHCSD